MGIVGGEEPWLMHQTNTVLVTHTRQLDRSLHCTVPSLMPSVPSWMQTAVQLRRLRLRDGA